MIPAVERLLAGFFTIPTGKPQQSRTTMIGKERCHHAHRDRSRRCRFHRAEKGASAASGAL